MPNFAANLGFLFQEVPHTQRFAAAARAGFTGVEHGRPYELDSHETVALLGEYDLSMVLINSPTGPDEAGGRGLACIPGREDEFKESIDTALSYAETIDCPRVHVLAGVAPKGSDYDLSYRTYVDNLRFAAEVGAEKGVKVLIEGINGHDSPGYFIDRPSLAVQVIEDVATPNLYLQFDVYHAQMTEGRLAATIEKALPLIDHIQIADVPGRHQPGSGEIRFRYLFRHLDDLGYEGWVGCEYHPDGDTADTLAWMEHYV